jgi:predicted GNAT superfamily acetyltransferase
VASETSAPGSGDIHVRTAAAADYDRIVAVMDDWWGRPVRQVLPRLFLDHFHGTSFVAEHDGALAGFLVGFLSPSMADTAYIHFVGVDPRMRGRGLARLLYERFFTLAAADGRRVVRAITAPVNTGSIAFHTAMGFTVTGPVDGYDGPGPAAAKVLFERALGPRPLCSG